MFIRLIRDHPADGATNMARDEALLERVGVGDSPPTLRLYEWAPPTISLGCFQPFAQYEALDPPAGGLPVVRRLTGGGAILHDRELTYSLTLPVTHPLLRRNPSYLYEMVHDALIAGLKEAGIDSYRGCETDGSSPVRGPFFCFARRHRVDVMIGLDKLAGSAQRMTRRAVLQHGSIMLEQRFAQQPIAALRSSCPMTVDELARRWIAALGWATGLSFEPGTWTEAELQLADHLTSKYAGAAWTRRR
jgi:lipoate-protein ligase A